MAETKFIKVLVRLLSHLELGVLSKLLQFLVVEGLPLPFPISNSQDGWKLLQGQWECVFLIIIPF